MKMLSEQTMIKRLEYAERRLKNRSRWNLFPRDSDQQLLRRQEHAHYTLLVFVAWHLLSWGGKSLVAVRDGFTLEFVVAVGLILWMFQIGYSLIRLRWTLEAFEQFGPQSVSELRTNIDEQVGTGQPATRPESKSEDGDSVQPDPEERTR